MVRHYAFICEVTDENKKNWSAGEWANQINEVLQGNFGLKGVPQHGCVTVARTEEKTVVEVIFWLEESNVTTVHDLIRNWDLVTIKAKLEQIGLKVIKEELRTE